MYASLGATLHANFHGTIPVWVKLSVQVCIPMTKLSYPKFSSLFFFKYRVQVCIKTFILGVQLCMQTFILGVQLCMQICTQSCILVCNFACKFAPKLAYFMFFSIKTTVKCNAIPKKTQLNHFFCEILSGPIAKSYPKLKLTARHQ